LYVEQLSQRTHVSANKCLATNCPRITVRRTIVRD